MRAFCSIHLAYFCFEAHDCYGSSTHYEVDTLFRVFVLKATDGSTKHLSSSTSIATPHSADA